MIFGLYAFLVGLCLTLIIVGIVLKKYSGIALIGFCVLFILSFIILNGNLEIKTGLNSTTTYTNDINGTILSTDEVLQYNYSNWEDTTSHQVGFWLAIFSAVGFITFLYSINKGGKNEEE